MHNAESMIPAGRLTDVVGPMKDADFRMSLCPPYSTESESDHARLIRSAALAVIICSCSPFGPRGDLEAIAPLPMPQAFSMPPTKGMSVPDRWWLALGDPSLNTIVEAALESNPRVHQTWARLERADGMRRQVAAARWPLVQVDLGASRQRQRFDLDQQTFVFTQNTFDTTFAASYELDLWGRVRALLDAGERRWEAARSDLAAASISLTATIAESWYDLVAARSMLAVLEKQRRTNEIYLELVELRYQEGLVSSTDVRQQRMQLDRLSAQAAILETQVLMATLGLQALLGGIPGLEGPRLPADTELPTLPTHPALGPPADLVERRPDLRAARKRLEAVDRELAAALAARLPTLRLSANAGFRSTSIFDLFETPIWSILAGLTTPIFQGGELAARVDEQEAARKEAAWLYVEMLIEAMREVESALAFESGQRERSIKLREARKANGEMLEELTESYVEGLVDYLQVARALDSLQSTEQQVLEAERDTITARVALYRALAGGWPTNDHE